MVNEKILRYYLTRINKLMIGNYIKQLLNPKQRKFLKKLLYTATNSKENDLKQRLTKIKTKLYNLGFTKQPIKELHELMQNPTSNIFKTNVAIELANWHLQQGSDIDYCLKLLSDDDFKVIDDSGIQRKASILRAKCYETLGKKEIGKLEVMNNLKVFGDDPNLFLSAANFEDTMIGKIYWINKALAFYNLSPISNITTKHEPSISLLKSNFQMHNKESFIRNSPLVTVIVSVYNSQKTIGYAIESILNQTWSNLEIIVVDDCSTDESASIVEEYGKKDYRIKLIRSDKNRGLFFSRNLALKQSKGEFVTTHDADDWSHAEKIECQVSHLQNNPKVIGNMSEAAWAFSKLKFYSNNNSINIISNFMCSFLFRRKPVLDSVGFWDSVRFSADNEYIRRIKKVFGHNSVSKLKTGPLTFYLQSNETLTGDQAFGHPGYYMGARKEYFEMQTYHHNRTRDLYYPFPQGKRPFPVPEPMWPLREKTGILGRRFFDIIFASDFRIQDDMLDTIIEHIIYLKQKNARIGIIQMYLYNLEPERIIHDKLRDIIDGERTQMIVYGESVSNNSLIIFDPMVLKEKQRYIPNVIPSNIYVVINKIYKNNNTDLCFNSLLNRCNFNLIEYFGQEGIWYPYNLSIREIINEFCTCANEAIDIASNNWDNVNLDQLI